MLCWVFHFSRHWLRRQALRVVIVCVPSSLAAPTVWNLHMMKWSGILSHQALTLRVSIVCLYTVHVLPSLIELFCRSFLAELTVYVKKLGRRTFCVVFFWSVLRHLIWCALGCCRHPLKISTWFNHYLFFSVVILLKNTIGEVWSHLDVIYLQLENVILLWYEEISSG